MALILCLVRGECSQPVFSSLFTVPFTFLFLEEEKLPFYFLHFTHPFLLIKESNNPGGKTNG